MSRPDLFTLKKVVFEYNAQPLFRDLSFALGEGKFYGLIGPNGSGKSTLIELLMGMREPSSGEIQYKAKDLHLYSRKELAKQLSLVPQRIALGFDFSVHDVVLMGRHPHIPRFSNPTAEDLRIVDEALALLDISHLRERPVTHLSGGNNSV